MSEEVLCFAYRDRCWPLKTSILIGALRRKSWPVFYDGVGASKEKQKKQGKACGPEPWPHGVCHLAREL